MNNGLTAIGNIVIAKNGNAFLQRENRFFKIRIRQEGVDSQNKCRDDGKNGIGFLHSNIFFKWRLY